MELLELLARQLHAQFGNAFAYDSDHSRQQRRKFLVHADAILALPEMQRMIQITRDYDNLRLGHDIRSE